MATKKIKTVSLESYTMETIPRSKIKTAEYNPRVIDENAKKRLKKGMKKFGLVQPLVWNKQTGVLVSGHQRLSIMDEMKKYPEKGDYDVQVAAVNLSPADERVLNVQLNNQSMMGAFDFDALSDLATFEGVDIAEFGFSEADTDIIFGADDSKMAGILGDSPDVQDAKGTLSQIKAERARMNDKYTDINSASYYFIVVCDSKSERAEFFEKMGVPFSEEFVSSVQLMRIFESQTDETDEQQAATTDEQ